MKRKYKKVKRNDFYAFFNGINWTEVEEINESECYVPEKKLHFKLLQIKGVHGTETSSDLRRITFGKEDTMFFIEVKKQLNK